MRRDWTNGKRLGVGERESGKGGRGDGAEVGHGTGKGDMNGTEKGNCAGTGKGNRKWVGGGKRKGEQNQGAWGKKNGRTKMAGKGKGMERGIRKLTNQENTG